MARLLIFACCWAVASAHNSLMIPVPRNAIDGADPRMVNGGHVPGGLTCTCANSVDCPMGSARKIAGAGQACLWWSQGCSIGCPYCLTDPKHPNNRGKIPTKAIEGNAPHSDKAGFRKAYCANPGKSVLPKEYWCVSSVRII